MALTKISTAARLWNGFIYNSVVTKQKLEDKISGVGDFVKGKVSSKETSSSDQNVKNAESEKQKQPTESDTKDNIEIIVEDKVEDENIIDVECEEVKTETVNTKEDDGFTYTGPDFSNLKEENITKDDGKKKEVTEETLNEAIKKESQKGNKQKDKMLNQK